MRVYEMSQRAVVGKKEKTECWGGVGAEAKESGRTRACGRGAGRCSHRRHGFATLLCFLTQKAPLQCHMPPSSDLSPST